MIADPRQADMLRAALQSYSASQPPCELQQITSRLRYLIDDYKILLRHGSPLYNQNERMIRLDETVARLERLVKGDG